MLLTSLHWVLQPSGFQESIPFKSTQQPIHTEFQFWIFLNQVLQLYTISIGFWQFVQGYKSYQFWRWSKGWLLFNCLNISSTIWYLILVKVPTKSTLQILFYFRFNVVCFVFEFSVVFFGKQPWNIEKILSFVCFDWIQTVYTCVWIIIAVLLHFGVILLTMHHDKGWY